MKKLMIAVAIVCAAAMVQAAAVDWKSGTVNYAKNADGDFGSTKAGATGNPTVSASLYAIDKGTYETWLAALTADVAAGSKTIYDAAGSLTQLGDTVSFSKGAAKLTDTRSIADAKPESPIDLYSAIIYSYTDGDGKNWYIANVATQHYEADVGGAIDGLGLSAGGLGTTTFSGWQTNAVPEPTSGLLLLLGVAGLALRRRRA